MLTLYQRFSQFGDFTPITCVFSVEADGLFTVWMCCSLSPQSLWEQVWKIQITHCHRGCEAHFHLLALGATESRVGNKFWCVAALRLCDSAQFHRHFYKSLFSFLLLYYCFLQSVVNGRDTNRLVRAWNNCTTFNTGLVSRVHFPGCQENWQTGNL